MRGVQACVVQPQLEYFAVDRNDKECRSRTRPIVLTAMNAPPDDIFQVVRCKLRTSCPKDLLACVASLRNYRFRSGAFVRIQLAPPVMARR